MFQDWISLYKQIRLPTFKKDDVVCPECGSDSIYFQYVGDERTRVGYLDTWCATCNKGVHFSRVSIPDGIPLIPFDAADEVIARRIPNSESVVAKDAA